MNRTFKAAVATLIIAVGFAASVAAGPFEDGQAADNRGDYATAMRLWRPLANQGNAAAQYELGRMYGHGKGVPVDPDAWRSWWRRAADGGYAEAQISLGGMYATGTGVPLDLTAAMRWYRKAADQGNAEAQYRLGFMYQYGMGVPQDYAAAARWYRVSANQGNDHWRTVAQTRAGLVEERNREAGTLAALKAERASVAAKGRQIETEATPIRYVAELIGADAQAGYHVAIEPVRDHEQLLAGAERITWGVLAIGRASPGRHTTKKPASGITARASETLIIPREGVIDTTVL